MRSASDIDLLTELHKRGWGTKAIDIASTIIPAAYDVYKSKFVACYKVGFCPENVQKNICAH